MRILNYRYSVLLLSAVLVTAYAKDDEQMIPENENMNEAGLISAGRAVKLSREGSEVSWLYSRGHMREDVEHDGEGSVDAQVIHMFAKVRARALC